MRALIQRAKSGQVTIDCRTHGKIGPGLVILLGITHADTAEDVDYLVNKCLHLRIFGDEENRMNRSLLDIRGEVLIVSQFTLYGSAVKGRRPSFTAAAEPQHAIRLYERFVAAFKAAGVVTATGEFGAEMAVSIVNDGPVTMMLESPSA